MSRCRKAWKYYLIGNAADLGVDDFDNAPAEGKQTNLIDRREIADDKLGQIGENGGG